MANKKSEKIILPHQQTKLYKRLEKLKDHEAIAKVNSFVVWSAKYLSLVGRDAFSTFTLHNENHSINLLKWADKIIPDETLKKLSGLELLVLIYSFYFHDIGMAVSYDKKDGILKREEFLSYFQSHPEFYDKIQELSKVRSTSEAAKQILIDERITDIYHATLTDYIRPKHAEKETYLQFVQEMTEQEKEMFNYKGVSFLDELVLICHSHNEATISLSILDDDGKKIYNPEYMLCGAALNIQYCAMVLRLCDIMDFDRERTPNLLFRAIGIEDKKMPGFKISLREWQKQMAVNTVSVEQDCIKVYAKCTSPNIERAIRIMCADLEREIRETFNILKENKKSITDKYKIELPSMVLPVIIPDKYVYKDYSIKLNEGAIVKLLMGESLYAKPQVAARELLQNAIDACLVRQGQDSTYVPQIKVSFETEDDHVWLVVEDNGIGMDEYVLSHYFFRIGNSYYTSSDFKALCAIKDFKTFNPISRFGIGFLSVFMIGDFVKVLTRNKLSKTNTHGSVLFVDGTESLAVFQKDDTLEQGTVIKVRLKPTYADTEHLRGIIGNIKEYFIRPAIPITLNIEGKETVIKDSGYLTLKKSEEERLVKEGVLPFKVDFSKYSEAISGYAYFFFFKDEDGKYYHNDPNDVRVWDMDILKIVNLYDNPECVNMVTVNGIKMTVQKIGGLFNVRKNIVPYSIDVNISSTSNVVFDVARQKIIGNGLDYVRCAIIDIIIKALKEEHIFEQLAEETQKRFTYARIRFGKLEPLDRSLLVLIEKCCPDGYYAIDNALLKSVAEQVDMDAGMVRPYLFAIRDMRKKK